KPTFGSVSCYGVTSLAPSLDHVGPIARTAGDAAILFDVICGYDARDPVSIQRSYKPVWPWAKANSVKGKKPLRGVRIGWPTEYFFDRVENEIVAALKRAGRTLESLGATINEISLPHIRESDNPSTHIALAEATAYHAAQGWFPAHVADYGE